MSNRFGARKPEEPPYLWTVARLSIYPVSPYSLFEDTVWRFDSLVAGHNTISINWILNVPNEVSNSQSFKRLIRDAKRALIACIELENCRPKTIISRASFFRKLVIWMFQNEYDSFSQLGAQARQEYFNFIFSQYCDDSRNLTVVDQVIDDYLSVFKTLYNLRGRFINLPRLQLGLGDLRHIDFTGSAKKAGARKSGTIPPVPEEVFNPMMTAALLWVQVYSEDVIELLHRQKELSDRSLKWRSHNYAYHVNAGLLGFQFRKCPTSLAPWREEIKPLEERIDVDEDGLQKRSIGPIRVLRRLVNSLLGACSIVIQGFSGMRISELLGLEEDEECESEWPSCVTVTQSVDSMNDIFLVNGQKFKGSQNGEVATASWVVGIRPTGSQFVPEAVRALLVLARLLKGWRSLTDAKSAFLYPSFAGGGLPRQVGSVGAMQAEALRTIQNQFLIEKVQLPVKFFGWNLTTHQFRKRFAQDIVRCDPKAMPAVREHFKHMSMHVLETGYLGNDAELLRIIDEAAFREAAAQMNAILDDEPVAGRMPELFRARIKSIPGGFAENCSAGERRAKIVELVESEGVKAWPCDFGTCLFRSETALCHFAAKGDYDSSASRPLASERYPDQCCKCSNLLISASHLSFWKNRYITNKKLALVHKEENNIAWGLLAHHRAKVAASVLKTHGVKVEELTLAA